ncbi:Sec-independent protein translocase protein TatCy [Kordia sp. SMS9]|uniref:twin-arginine translocase subunit TatC n=1 Tax=Kordia sp. SMS9 TaxID=2282170 RepID=UPI000E0D0185|nr:twin-arginine translocase subunit TatC [Kordia sp. SMS9]AXG71322.1 Sec-independent protein translocase protein TatCy [Kordia sp. SMS9]
MGKNKNEMSFLGHLEELRWHLIRSFVAIVIIASVIFVFITPIYDHFLVVHLDGEFVTYKFFCDAFQLFGVESDFCTLNFDDKLVNLSVTGQFTMAIWTSLILGLILAFPYILYEAWKFIAPGLSPKERKRSRWFIFLASLLFLFGLLFSYYVIMPMSSYFFYNFSVTETIKNTITVQSHISLLTNTLLGISLVFELPLIIYFLAKLGLITPAFLRKYRKHAIVVVLILSAIITPPDVASQIVVAIPIMMLYQVGIVIAKRVEKNYKKKFKHG